ncbi:MAG: acyl-CoA thioesterase [Candidatus Bipolaricaulia bacterium]
MTDKWLEDFPVVIELPVAWGEMDAFGHVNNIVYFRYFESARIAYFERIGFTEHMAQTGVGPILAATKCTFRKALTYPDTVSVGARITEVGEDRFTMLYRIVSQKLERVAAEGEGLIVSYDYRANRKAPLPAGVRGRIEALEGRSLPRPA